MLCHEDYGGPVEDGGQYFPRMFTAAAAADSLHHA